MKFFTDNLFLWVLLFLAVVAPSFLFGAIQLVVVIVVAFVILLIIGGVVVRWKLYNLKKRAGEGYFQSADSTTNSSDPDVKIYQTRSAGDKKVASDVGDYVDFEEVDKE